MVAQIPLNGATPVLNTAPSKDDAPTLSRRASVRFRCDRTPTRRVFLVESYRTLAAEVYDLSLGGVGLVCERALDLGTLLFIDLLGMEVAPEYLARVVHSTPRDGNQYLIGCEFERALTQEELDAILNVRS
jgi:hypothetical protein